MKSENGPKEPPTRAKDLNLETVFFLPPNGPLEQITEAPVCHAVTQYVVKSKSGNSPMVPNLVMLSRTFEHHSTGTQMHKSKEPV